MSRTPTHPSQEKREEDNTPSYYPIRQSGIVDLGLDTITWRATTGNLKIVQEMEDFMNSLQKKYIGVSAYPIK